MTFESQKTKRTDAKKERRTNGSAVGKENRSCYFRGQAKKQAMNDVNRLQKMNKYGEQFNITKSTETAQKLIKLNEKNYFRTEQTRKGNE